MRHASGATLETIGALLDKLSAQNELRQKSPGIYYRKAKPFLHFHEDGADVFADLKIGGEWKRFRANSKAEQAQFLRAVALELSNTP